MSGRSAVRLALGAQPADVRAMVLRQSFSAALVSVIAGLAAYALTHVMASLLFEVSARDPVAFAAAALVLTSVTAVAAYLPARRATRVNPMVALRYE